MTHFVVIPNWAHSQGIRSGRVSQQVVSDELNMLQETNGSLLTSTPFILGMIPDMICKSNFMMKEYKSLDTYLIFEPVCTVALISPTFRVMF